MQATPSSHSRSQFRPSTQHPTPLQVSAALSAPCTWPLCRAGRAKRLPQNQQLSGVPCPHTFPHLLVTSMRLRPTGTTLSRGWSSGSTGEYCPLWSHQAGPALTLTAQWEAAQLPLLLFVFKGELNTAHKTGNSVAPAKTQPQPHSAVCWPFHGWAQGIQLPPLSSSPGVPHAYLSFRLSTRARTRTHTAPLLS